MQLFCKAWKWLSSTPHQLMGVRILQIAVGVTLLFNVCTLLPFATFLWGPHGVGLGSTKPILDDNLGNFFDLFFLTDARIFYLLTVLSIMSLWLIIGYNTRFASFIAFIVFFLLKRRLPEMGDAGDNLTQIVLIYMLLLLPYRANVSPGQFRVWLHNIGILAITFQLAIIYFASGFAKAGGDLWQQGIAMYYISQVQWLMLPSSHYFLTNPWIVTLATYVPIIYQLLFPVAIISPVKLPWICFGILFHIAIAILMGMVSFSTVMIGLELFLISDQEYVQIWKKGCLLGPLPA